MKKTLTAAAAVLIALAAHAQPKRTPEEIRKRLAELKAEVARLEKELEAVEPDKSLEWKIGSTGTVPLPERADRWGVIRVIEPGVVYAVGKFPNSEIDRGTPFIVKGVPTAGLRQGGTLKLAGRFKVTGEMVVGNNSVFVVEPTTK